MKTIRFIQNVMVGVGIVTAIALVDQIEVEPSNMWAAIVITILSVIIVIEQDRITNNGTQE